MRFGVLLFVLLTSCVSLLGATPPASPDSVVIPPFQPVSLDSATHAMLWKLWVRAGADDPRWKNEIQPAREALRDKGDRALTFLLEQAVTRDPVEQLALEQIFPLFGEKALGALVLGADDTIPDKSALMLRILAYTKDRRIRPVLRKHARSPRTVVRLSAVEGLGILADTSAATLLIEVLQDTVPEVRRQAVIALGKILPSNGIAPLILALRDSVPAVRFAAVNALAGYGPAAVELLQQRVESSHGTLKALALEALGKIHAPASRALIQESLADLEPSVRATAYEALSYYPMDVRTINLLKEGLHDADAYVAAKAVEAVQRATK